MHTELQSKHGRDADIVVTGLTQQDGEDDKNVLSTFLEHELTVVHCKRLGRTTTQNSRPRPLLAVLDSSFNARLVLSAAKRLQDSDDPYVRSNVFINPNMTRAEAQAAYEARCRRRERRQPSRSVRGSERQQRQEADRTAGATDVNRV